MTTLDLTLTWVLTFGSGVALMGLVDYLSKRNKNK